MIALCILRITIFCRVHSTLRVTSAMAAGVSMRVWDLRESIA
jgi:hypothetical protein